MADELSTELPKASDLDVADWGREVVPSAEPAPTQEVAPEVSHETSESDPDEESARTRGWVPETEWRGPKERWVDARAFNERYETVLPVVQRENKKLADENKTMRAQLADLSAKAQQWEKAQAESRENQAKLRLDTLKMERKNAIENQDYDTLIRVDDELLELRVAEKTAPQRVTTEQIDPTSKYVLESFVSDNPVFKDPRYGQLLAQQATAMRQAGSTLKYRDFLDEASEQVKAIFGSRYPELLGRSTSNTPQRRHPLGETGSSPAPGRSASGRVWSDLVPEAREAAEKFIATTPGATKEAWLKNAGPEFFRR